MFPGDELFTDAQKLRLSEDGTCICFDTKVTSSSYYSELKGCCNLFLAFSSAVFGGKFALSTDNDRMQ